VQPWELHAQFCESSSHKYTSLRYACGPARPVLFWQNKQRQLSGKASFALRLHPNPTKPQDFKEAIYG
jgi:hypothetical protein